MRTFVKKVETAIASGDKSAAAEALAGCPAGDAASFGQGRDPRQHGGPQVVPLVRPDQGAAERLILPPAESPERLTGVLQGRMIRPDPSSRYYAASAFILFCRRPVERRFAWHGPRSVMVMLFRSFRFVLTDLNFRLPPS